MRPRQIISFLAVLGCGIALCSCLTQEQHDATMRVVDEMVKNGAVTDAQAAILRNAIDQASQFRMLEPLLGAVSGMLGVRVWRGPSASPDERVERKRKYRAIRKKKSATSPAKQEN